MYFTGGWANAYALRKVTGRGTATLTITDLSPNFSGAGLFNGCGQAEWVTCNSSGQNLIVTSNPANIGEGIICKSTNYGASGSWTKLTIPTVFSTSNHYIQSMVADSTLTNIVICDGGPSYTGGIWTGNGINPTTENLFYVSTDSGATWTGQLGPNPFSGATTWGAPIFASPNLDKFALCTANKRDLYIGWGTYMGAFGNGYLY